ncbi:MAG TPA: cytochrome C oxidase subunit IV family protein [Rhodothermales bacterium]|nr:cytochrome C oxidase subunit IV family protein [Rhodothermales bacterium]
MAVHTDDHHGHHIIPMPLLLKVFGGLVFLTILTVLTATQLDLGPLNVPIALAIAFTKAGLVLAFFMALKYDNRVNTLVFSLGVIFVAVFLIFTLFDTAFRGDLDNVDAETIADQERAEQALLGIEPEPAARHGAEAEHGAAADSTEAAAADSTAHSAADTTSAATDTTQAEAADTISAEGEH